MSEFFNYQEIPYICRTLASSKTVGSGLNSREILGSWELGVLSTISKMEIALLEDR